MTKRNGNNLGAHKPRKGNPTKPSLPARSVEAKENFERPSINVALRAADLTKLIDGIKSGDDTLTGLMVDFFAWYLTTPHPASLASSFLAWKAFGSEKASELLEHQTHTGIWAEDITASLQAAIMYLVTSGIIKPSNLKSLMSK